MNASDRRKKIATTLCQADAPISATSLASAFSVSRQVIVGDIALLRASGLAILATPRGYIIESAENDGFVEKSIVSRHDDDRMGEELYTIVDLGGSILDVTVEHSIYGQICAPLRIASRFDADSFLNKVERSGARPLCELTDGVHLHTIRCADQDTMSRIESSLFEKGFLLRD